MKSALVDDSFRFPFLSVRWFSSLYFVFFDAISFLFFYFFLEALLPKILSGCRCSTEKCWFQCKLLTAVLSPDRRKWLGCLKQSTSHFKQGKNLCRVLQQTGRIWVAEWLLNVNMKGARTAVGKTVLFCNHTKCLEESNLQENDWGILHKNGLTCN